MQPQAWMGNGIGAPETLVFCVASLFQDAFSVDWLIELTGFRASKVLASLDKGVREGYLRQLTPATYTFADKTFQRHWQELLHPQTATTYRMEIVNLLVRELPDDEKKAELLVPYLLAIPNSLQNCRWLLRAGDSFRSRFHVEVALECYSKALEDVSHLAGKEADRLFVEASIRYSKLSTARVQTTWVLKLLEQALERADKWGFEPEKALLKMHIAKNEWLLSRYESAIKNFNEGWVLATGTEDPELLRSANVLATFFFYWQGRFAEAIRIYEKTGPDIQKYPPGDFSLLACITIGHCYVQIGQINLGLGMLDSIRKHCLDLGNKYLAALAEVMIGEGMLQINDVGAAMEHLQRGLREAVRERNEWATILGTLFIAFGFYSLGEEEKCLKAFRDFLRHSKSSQVIVRPYPYILEICWAMKQGSLPCVPAISLEGEVAKALHGANVFMAGVAYRFQALLEALNGAEMERVKHFLILSLKYLEDSGHQIQCAKTHMEIARLSLTMGMKEGARDHAMRAAQLLGSLTGALFPKDLRHLLGYCESLCDPLEQIVNLGVELGIIREPKDLLQRILLCATQVTGAERGAIFLVEGPVRSANLKLRASKNLTPSEILGESFLPSWKIIKETLRQKKPIMVASNNKPGLCPSQEGQVRSCICVPMILRDRIIGILYQDNRILDTSFREQDLKFLAYFSSLAAIALDNALAYEEIRRLNEKLMQEKEYYREQHVGPGAFEDLVGESRAIRRVLSQIKQVADTDVAVLILGESGVGKGLVARAIHRSSSRRAKPFVEVHCGALPESLIPSELFGHEKGAFTGATSRKVGRFELADGGTLFLDEVGDLSQEIQVRLLRVLQTKEFERVGSSKTIRSDFRLIAATNKHLEREVRAGKFRLDLYYRIAVFPIEIPPLRDRKEDIPLLAEFFLNAYAKKLGKQFGPIPQSEIDKMMKYDWPGNVRELENVIERAVIISPGPTLVLPDFFIRPRSELAPFSEEEMSLEENERRHILRVLHYTNWRIRGPRGAAEILRVHPSTLYFRMKKLGIRRP